MPVHIDSVLQQALELPPIERARLIEEILESFEFSHKEKINAKWAVEAESRVEAYEKGLITARPIHEVFEKINKLK